MHRVEENTKFLDIRSLLHYVIVYGKDIDQNAEGTLEHSFLKNKEKTIRLVLEKSRHDSLCL